MTSSESVTLNLKCITIVRFDLMLAHLALQYDGVLVADIQG